VEVVAVLQDVSSARWLDGLDLKVMQAPVWPATFKRDAERERLSSATFADTLADFGLANAEALRLLMAAWDQLFNLIKPDLVIAEGAPIASLTARGRIPLALVGTGFALPPAEMERFPLLHQASAPVWREEDLLDIVNRALRQIGSLPLDRLPQMFAADVRMVATFPLLDPYCAQRTEPAEGPFFDRAPLARREEAETVLAYFSTRLDTTRPELIDALRSIASQLRIFAPGFSAGSRGILARAGARVEAGPMPLTQLVCDYIEAEGFTVHDRLALEIEDNCEVGARDPLALVDIFPRVDIHGVDALVLSACVQMPSLEAIPIVEKKVGIPVISAAVCTTFRMLQQMDLKPVAPNAGALLSGRFGQSEPTRTAA